MNRNHLAWFVLAYLVVALAISWFDRGVPVSVFGNFGEWFGGFGALVAVLVALSGIDEERARHKEALRASEKNHREQLDLGREQYEQQLAQVQLGRAEAAVDAFGAAMGIIRSEEQATLNLAALRLQALFYGREEEGVMRIEWAEEVVPVQKIRVRMANEVELLRARLGSESPTSLESYRDFVLENSRHLNLTMSTTDDHDGAPVDVWRDIERRKWNELIRDLYSRH